ncbi:MAG: coproporphyrinogen III oxidase, partial [Anaerolineae bacterium]|nr:coproporphyrinogen III oxidase [Anaerolineae bacterium]
LRLTQEGIGRAAFRDRFGEDVAILYAELINRFVERGLLTMDSESLRLTKTGRLLSNLIFRELV